MAEVSDGAQRRSDDNRRLVFWVIAAPAIALALMGLVLYLGNTGLNAILDQTRQIVSRNLDGSVKVAEIAKRVQTVNASLYRLMTLQAAEVKDTDVVAGLITLGDEVDHIIVDLGAYRDGFADEGQAEAIDKAIRQLKDYKVAVQWVASMLEIDFASTVTFIRPFNGMFDRLTSDLAGMTEAAAADAHHLSNQATADASATFRWFLVIMAAAAVGVSGLTWLTGRHQQRLIFNARHLEGEVAARTRELSEQSGLLQAALSNMSDGLVTFDAGRRLRVWNDRAMAMLAVPEALRRVGTPYDELMAANAGVVWPSDDALPVGKWTEMELADGRVVQERRNSMPDGGVVRVYLDVTEDRRREHELRETNEQLKAAQVQLVQAEKMAALGQLVAGVAHEINTPIGIALTCVTYLSDQAVELKGLLAGSRLRRSDLEQFIATVDETTGLLVSNIARTSNLVHGFKQVAADQTTDARRRFDLPSYLDEVMVSLGPSWKTAGHRVAIDCPAGVEVDSYPGVLSQILNNLVMNSLVHAFDAGQSGRLSITATTLDDDTVELVYADDGRGIPAEHHSKVFDPFFTTRRGAGSSGLGLHIVFNLVTVKLRGRIDMDSTEGQGTRFTIRFPRVLPEERMTDA